LSRASSQAELKKILFLAMFDELVQTASGARGQFALMNKKGGKSNLICGTYLRDRSTDTIKKYTERQAGYTQSTAGWYIGCGFCAVA